MRDGEARQTVSRCPRTPAPPPQGNPSQKAACKRWTSAVAPAPPSASLAGDNVPKVCGDGQSGPRQACTLLE